MREFINILTEATKIKNKIDRSTFVYLSPKTPKDDFAQCETCVHFIPDKGRCAILSPNDKVNPKSSCGLYLNGQPNDDQTSKSIVSVKEVGLVDGPVQCQNCSWSDGKGDCELYKMLNESQPDVFDLDTKIEANGCCNAWTSS